MRFYELLSLIKIGGGGGVCENVSLGTRVAVCTLKVYTYVHACILMQLMGRIIRLFACTQSDYVQKLNVKSFLVISLVHFVYSRSRVHLAISCSLVGF